MTSGGDLLLFAVTAAGPMSWPSFSRAYNALLSSAEAQGGVLDPGRRKRRSRALLDALGHCETTYGEGSSTTVAAPAVLARIPVSGLPKALLVGARQPSAIPCVLEACGGVSGVTVSLDDPSGRAGAPAPTRVELEAEDSSRLEAVARRVGIPYLDTPPAWMIASASAGLSDVLAGLEWQVAPELNWIRKEFDPDAIRFTPAGPRSGPMLCLRSYQHPVKPDQHFILWRGEESARVDARWGRYAVLAAARRRVLLYDQQRNRLAVPAGAPLPRLISRALCLCSGWPPDFVPAAALGTRQAGSWGAELYSAVGPDMAAHIGMKTGQQLWPASLAHSPEATA
jgi:hypothetical protein